MSSLTNFINLDSALLYIGAQINEVILYWWWYLIEISWQLAIAFVAYLCTCVFLYFVLKQVNHKAWQIPGPPNRLLLLIAHPDDEVMFFGPLIYWLVRMKTSQIYVLCFTMGRNKERKEELWACAKKLGISEANITILMYTELPDDTKVQWPETLVAENILHYIELYKINAVITFDKYGVSKHKNHISLFYGMASLCMDRKVPSYCKLYALESVNILRKYTQILDLPISLLSASYWYVVTYDQRQYIKEAMKEHKSQYIWFRKLYMIFSRYTLINTFQEVNFLDLELDLQFEED